VPLPENDEVVQALVRTVFTKTFRVRVCSSHSAAGIGTHFTPPVFRSAVHACVNTGSDRGPGSPRAQNPWPDRADSAQSALSNPRRERCGPLRSARRGLHLDDEKNTM